MAAGAWIIFDGFQQALGDANMDLGGGTFYCALFTSAANLSAGANSALSSFGSVTGEVAEANGYSSSGKTLSATTWAAGASGGVRRFDSTAVFWSANGGNISAIKFGVVWQSGGRLVCYSTLSTSQFSLTDTNRLTITPSANGLFEMTKTPAA